MSSAGAVCREYHHVSASTNPALHQAQGQDPYREAQKGAKKQLSTRGEEGQPSTLEFEDVSAQDQAWKMYHGTRQITEQLVFLSPINSLASERSRLYHPKRERQSLKRLPASVEILTPPASEGDCIGDKVFKR